MNEPKLNPFTVVYSEDYLDWQLENGVTNPQRARIATRHLVDECGDAVTVLDPSILPVDEVRSAIEMVHTPEYAAQVIDEGISVEFPRPDHRLGEVAQLMFAGTVLAVREVLAGNTRIAFNPQGAKHHAKAERGSGFCVFNDMAWAALHMEGMGRRPLYLDWDVHAGDGVQEMLSASTIPTLSIHQGSIFPSDYNTKDRALASEGVRHTHHLADKAAYNWNMERNAGDEAFRWAIDEAIDFIRDYKPDTLLLAIGADAHGGQLLATAGTNVTYAGFDYAAGRVREIADELGVTGIVMGGAGGYQPLDHTPRIWANVVKRIATDPSGT
jgi:acetoin utilization protein AcuC